MSESKHVSAALVAAQSKIRNVPFDSTNPHFGSKFVSLAAVLDAVRPILSAHGLALFQPASTANGMVQVSTVFMHESGEQVAFPPLALPITEKTTAQALGSMVTYLRRYSLTAAVGIAGDEDTDGNDVSQPAQQPARRSAPVDAPQAVPASGGGGGSLKPSQARIAAPSPGNALPGDGEQDMDAKVTFLEVKEGVSKAGKPYTKARVGLKPTAGGEAVFASGFGASLIALVTNAKECGQPIRATVKQTQYGFDLVHATYVPQPAAQGDDSDIPF
jgi:hypothetical protein